MAGIREHRSDIILQLLPYSGFTFCCFCISISARKLVLHNARVNLAVTDQLLGHSNLPGLPSTRPTGVYNHWLWSAMHTHTSCLHGRVTCCGVSKMELMCF